jgi:hypothetical protein
MRSFFFCCFTIVVSTLSSQYISSVTQPDATKYLKNRGDDVDNFANDITADDMKKHLYIIASKEMEGRETGYEGNVKAANYIMDQLKSYDLQPVKGQSSFLQPIALTYTSWANNKILINGKDFRHLWDYIAFPATNNNLKNEVIKEVIFLGYGIDDKKYTDYKKAKNLKGKTIMINEGEPMDAKENYIISNDTSAGDWSKNLDKKIQAAKKREVKNILVISNDIKKLMANNRRALLGATVELSNTLGKVFDKPNIIYISSTIAKEIIGSNEEIIKSLRSDKIAKNKKYTPPVLSTDLNLTLEKKQSLVEGNNIATIIEGGSKKDEVIVVSAHYDHIGKKGDVLYPGADDNGSGTTTLLELAQSLSLAKKMGKTPARSILLLWMTGEEKGLLGSQFYAENPLIPIKNTVADINIDMVGRMDKKYEDQKISDYVYVIGSDRLSTDLHKINEDVNNKYTQFIMDYTYNDEADPNRYYYRSDHYNFAKKGIPAIFFFTGVHDDYHQPGDTPDKIGYERMAKVGKHIFYLAWEIADRPDRIKVDGQIK